MTARLYLDYAATTPLRAEARAAMLPYLDCANPSSPHAEGRAARAALDVARVAVARAIGAKPREIVFTGGGSEADALAILGSVRAARAAGRPERATGCAVHVVTAATEHRAVLHAVETLRDEGVAVTVLGVDGDGRVDPAAFAAALRPETVLASIMLANNEIGTLAPVATLAALARARGVPFHCDAVQAPGRVPVDVGVLGVDLLTLSAHKCYGPKGVAALFVRAGHQLASLVPGGGQEGGRRSGTENVAGIAGFAAALSLAVTELDGEAARLRALRDRFERDVLARIPGARVNGAGAPRLPNIASVGFADVDASELLVRLDLDGVAVATGSACASGAAEPSHVLAALDASEAVRRGTLRFSFGRDTREQDVADLARMLPEIVASVRVAASDVGRSVVGSFASPSEVRS